MMSEKKESKRNEKTILALSGWPGKGKSTTIRKVYSLLKSAYPEAARQAEWIHPENEPEDMESAGDICVLMPIGRVWLGIESEGDPGSRLSQSLKKFAEHQPSCDLILCATRSKGNTVKAVERMQPEYKIKRILKKHHHDNTECANYLFERLMSLL